MLPQLNVGIPSIACSAPPVGHTAPVYRIARHRPRVFGAWQSPAREITTISCGCLPSLAEDRWLSTELEQGLTIRGKRRELLQVAADSGPCVMVVKRATRQEGVEDAAPTTSNRRHNHSAAGEVSPSAAKGESPSAAGGDGPSTARGERANADRRGMTSSSRGEGANAGVQQGGLQPDGASTAKRLRMTVQAPEHTTRHTQISRANNSSRRPHDIPTTSAHQWEPCSQFTADNTATTQPPLTQRPTHTWAAQHDGRQEFSSRQQDSSNTRLHPHPHYPPPADSIHTPPGSPHHRHAPSGHTYHDGHGTDALLQGERRSVVASMALQAHVTPVDPMGTSGFSSARDDLYASDPVCVGTLAASWGEVRSEVQCAVQSSDAYLVGATVGVAAGGAESYLAGRHGLPHGLPAGGMRAQHTAVAVETRTVSSTLPAGPVTRVPGLHDVGGREGASGFHGVAEREGVSGFHGVDGREGHFHALHHNDSHSLHGRDDDESITAVDEWAASCTDHSHSPGNGRSSHQNRNGSSRSDLKPRGVRFDTGMPASRDVDATSYEAGVNGSRSHSSSSSTRTPDSHAATDSTAYDRTAYNRAAYDRTASHQECSSSTPVRPDHPHVVRVSRNTRAGSLGGCVAKLIRSEGAADVLVMGRPALKVAMYGLAIARSMLQEDGSGRDCTLHCSWLQVQGSQLSKRRLVLHATASPAGASPSPVATEGPPATPLVSEPFGPNNSASANRLAKSMVKMVLRRERVTYQAWSYDGLYKVLVALAAANSIVHLHSQGEYTLCGFPQLQSRMCGQEQRSLFHLTIQLGVNPGSQQPDAPAQHGHAAVPGAGMHPVSGATDNDLVQSQSPGGFARLWGGADSGGVSHRASRATHNDLVQSSFPAGPAHHWGSRDSEVMSHRASGATHDGLVQSSSPSASSLGVQGLSPGGPEVDVSEVAVFDWFAQRSLLRQSSMLNKMGSGRRMYTHDTRESNLHPNYERFRHDVNDWDGGEVAERTEREQLYYENEEHYFDGDEEVQRHYDRSNRGDLLYGDGSTDSSGWNEAQRGALPPPGGNRYAQRLSSSYSRDEVSRESSLVAGDDWDWGVRFSQDGAKNGRFPAGTGVGVTSGLSRPVEVANWKNRPPEYPSLYTNGHFDSDSKAANGSTHNTHSNLRVVSSHALEFNESGDDSDYVDGEMTIDAATCRNIGRGGQGTAASEHVVIKSRTSGGPPPGVPCTQQVRPSRSLTADAAGCAVAAASRTGHSGRSRGLSNVAGSGRHRFAASPPSKVVSADFFSFDSKLESAVKMKEVVAVCDESARKPAKKTRHKHRSGDTVGAVSAAE